MDSKAVLFVILGKLNILQLSVVHHLHEQAKSNRSCRIVSHITKTFQNFWLTLV